MKDQKKGESLEIDWDFFKSDVFSLGLTLLSAVLIFFLPFQATLKGAVNLNTNKKLMNQRLEELFGNREYGKLFKYNFN